MYNANRVLLGKSHMMMLINLLATFETLQHWQQTSPATQLMHGFDFSLPGAGQKNAAGLGRNAFLAAKCLFGASGLGCLAPLLWGEWEPLTSQHARARTRKSIGKIQRDGKL